MPINNKKYQENLKNAMNMLAKKGYTYPGCYSKPRP